MQRPKVLLLGKIEHATATWRGLNDIAELVHPESAARQAFIQECRSGTLDGVVAICDRAPSSLAVTGKYDQELVDALPRTVRFICHNGAGYDNIDTAACSARSILVSNCPRVVEDASADTTMFLILAALRGFNNGLLAIRNGTWKGAVPPPPLGHDPQGKVLGVLGMGGIGRNLKKKAECFGMIVIYHNRSKLGQTEADGAEYVSFDELLRRSDVVSLNLPLNSETRNIVSKNEFRKMKDGVIVVNTARGGVMDEEALVQAIESGKVLSAGLDVYQQEPDIHPGLLANPHACMLPHMGTSTVETKTKMEELTLSNVRAALETGKLRTVVPEQVAINVAQA